MFFWKNWAAAFAGFCGGALLLPAANAQTATALPAFAMNPQGLSQGPSLWNGLYAGSEIMAVSRRGAKGQVGGGGYIGYRQKFDNNFFVAVQGGAGYMPTLNPRASGVNGFDYALTQVKLGYDFGRLRPYVTAGVGVASPTGYTAFATSADSLNSVLNGGRGGKTLTSLGAGFDYAITNKLSVGMGVSVNQVRGNGLSPFHPVQ